MLLKSPSCRARWPGRAPSWQEMLKLPRSCRQSVAARRTASWPCSRYSTQMLKLA